jgi:hypothetical protein
LRAVGFICVTNKLEIMARIIDKFGVATLVTGLKEFKDSYYANIELGGVMYKVKVSKPRADVPVSPPFWLEISRAKTTEL